MFLFAHLRQDFLSDDNDAFQVGIDLVVDVFVARLFQKSGNPKACVIDEHVQTAKLASRLGHGRLDTCTVFHIEPGNKDYSKDVFDPMLAVLRSVGSEAVQSMFKEVVDSDVIGKLSEQINQENAQQRAGLIVALLFGFDALNRIFEVEVFSEADQQSVSTLFADTIQSLLS